MKILHNSFWRYAVYKQINKQTFDLWQGVKCRNFVMIYKIIILLGRIESTKTHALRDCNSVFLISYKHSCICIYQQIYQHQLSACS